MPLYAASGMADVNLERVSKRYSANAPLAVRDLDLRVADGEFVALVGPSGCGKTTTLRMVAGLERPDGGTIFIAGKPMNGVSPRDRNVAFVPQDPTLYPHMTAGQNLGFALRMRGMPRDVIERRVGHVAATLGIADLLKRTPGTMSSGQQQRVAFGRALVRLPEATILLLDEPLSSLDAASRTLMRSEIKRVRQAMSMTALYVTHDQSEAMALGDRIVVMAAGVNLQEGKPMEVYRRPANRFVAGFIGSPPMNFIEGSVTRAGTQVIFAPVGGAPLNLGLAKSPSVMTGSQQATLGVRPEDLRIAETPDDGCSLDATVQFVEPLGGNLLVHATTSGSSPIVASLSYTRAIRSGERVRITFSPETAHVFAHGQFGERLLA